MSRELKDLESNLMPFKAWLIARGAEVLSPTNEWEVVRFRTNEGVSIIYKKKHGALTFTGESFKVWNAYQSNGAWRAAPATKRKLKSSPTCASLRKRDGNACFYCHQLVEVADESIEHLVAITHGGPDHLANMVLAHRAPCNANAGHLSVMEKIRLREANAVQVTSAPVQELTAQQLSDLGPPWKI